MRVHALQVDSVWEDHDASRVRVESLLKQANPLPGDFVVAPELCETGFTMRAEHAASRDSTQWVLALAKRHRVWLQCGIARRTPEGIANAAVVAAPDGREIGVYHKVFLFTPDGERDHYRAGSEPLVIECDGVKVAPLICYDLRFPELWRRAALRGAEVFTLGACWPARRAHHWTALIAARAIENQAWVIAANGCGTEPTGPRAGASCIIDHDGATRSHCGSCAAVASSELDLAALREWRTKFPALRDARRNLLGL